MTDRSTFERLTEDFATKPVPDASVVSGYRIALVVIGFAITLPVLLTGSRIGLGLGFWQSVLAFVTGGLVLAAIGGTTAYIGAKARLSTYMLIQFPFGPVGAKFVNTLIALTLFGWYAVTAGLFGEAAHNAMVELFGVGPGHAPLTVLGGLLMVATTMWGFKALDKLALVAVPLMAVFLAALVGVSVQHTPWPDIVDHQGGELGYGVATSLVIGSYIVGSILLPDLSRYARRGVDGMWAAFAALGIAFPCIFLVAMIPSVAVGEQNLVAIMMGLGMGVPALAMIVFATWTTNANNLYSTSLTLATVFDGVRKWKITVAAGIAGTVLATVGVIEYFTTFLLFLGVAIPPVAGIFVVDYFVVRQQRYDPRTLSEAEPLNRLAFAAWAAASTIGSLTANNSFHLTGIPACDAIVCSMAFYFAGTKIRLRQDRPV